LLILGMRGSVEKDAACGATCAWRGLFGTAITPKIAVATLVLHLIYGVTLGGGLQLVAVSPPPQAAAGA
jgi:hypothetical protein